MLTENHEGQKFYLRKRLEKIITSDDLKAAEKTIQEDIRSLDLSSIPVNTKGNIKLIQETNHSLQHQGNVQQLIGKIQTGEITSNTVI